MLLSEEAALENTCR